MAIDPVRLMSFEFPEVEQTYTSRDTMLYALGIGYGSDPLDERELRYVYEKDQVAAPTFPLVLGFSSIRNLDLGIDYRKVVHSAQRLEVHEPAPPQGTVVCKTRISEVWDLGADRGALLRISRDIRDKSSGRLIATAAMDAMCRGDGGFGGAAPPPRDRSWPDSPPDHVVKIASLPQQALIYRLSGDLNPLHADPAVATAAGFRAPILHGLATLGMAVRAILALTGADDSPPLRFLESRFTAPFFPGETLLLSAWPGGGKVLFRAASAERGVVVLDAGECVFQES